MKSDLFAISKLQSLPNDNYEAVHELCMDFEKFVPRTTASLADHDDLVEALGILKAFVTVREFPVPDFPTMGSDQAANISQIRGYFYRLEDSTTTERLRRRSQSFFESKTEEYTAVFSKTAIYEFSDDDFNRIQVLINDLREEISKSTLISEDHKRRLLRRLEAMQRELHKRTSDIDRFWGFIGEAGITLRKFGEDIKPIADRVQELGRIIIAVIFAKEGIKALPDVSKIVLPDK